MRAVRAAGVWRIASALVGELGALMGVAKGAFFFMGLLWMVALANTDVLPGRIYPPYHALWMGLEGGTVVFSLLGMVGVGFTIAGRCRTGAWIMAISATGVATSVAIFTLIRPRLLYPLGEPGYPLSPGSYVVHLFPILLLLVGAGVSRQAITVTRCETVQLSSLRWMLRYFVAPCTVRPPWLEYPQRMVPERRWQVGIGG